MYEPGFLRPPTFHLGWIIDESELAHYLEEQYLVTKRMNRTPRDN